MDFPPLPPRLETERLILTPEVEEDVEWLTELLNARGAGRFTIEDSRDRIAEMTTAMTATGVGAFVLRKRPDGEPIGYCAIIVGRSSLSEPEIAFELLPRAHGHGYARERAGSAREIIRCRNAATAGATLGVFAANDLQVPRTGTDS